MNQWKISDLETALGKSSGNTGLAGHLSQWDVGAIMFSLGHGLISASGGPGRLTVVAVGVRHADKHCIGVCHHHRAFGLFQTLQHL